MMDQAAVHAAVAVLEWVDVHKAKSRRRGFQHRVEAIFAHTFIRVQQAGHESAQIFSPGADEFREWIAIMVPFSHEYAVWTKPGLNESCVLQEYPLKPHDFIDR